MPTEKKNEAYFIVDVDVHTKVSQGYAGNWVSMIAGLVIVMIPTFIVFVLLQRHITGGLTIGALKG